MLHRFACRRPMLVAALVVGSLVGSTGAAQAQRKSVYTQSASVRKAFREVVSQVRHCVVSVMCQGEEDKKPVQVAMGTIVDNDGYVLTKASELRGKVRCKRDGKEYSIAFAHGEKVSDLKEIGTVGKKNTGTHIRFWPETKYFDSPKFSVTRLKHVLRAKAVLCPGLHVVFFDEKSGESEEWYYEDGLKDYLTSALKEYEMLPVDPFIGSMAAEHEAGDPAIRLHA